jgi:2-polyprenyl-6-methoxyphenol hydroxylase-like FAD-dependent oxidoreductase
MNKKNESKIDRKSADRDALIIGGSLAGLFAARVLADYFNTVTILDRDIFPPTPDHRNGVPQSYHAHGLLPTAFPIIEQLFPGIINDLCKDGADVVSDMIPLAIVSPKGLLPLPKMHEVSISFSRPLLEWHVRNHISKFDNIHIDTNTEVIGLLTTSDRTGVIGVQMHERGVKDCKSDVNTRLYSDLVVDASGRHSKAPLWLAELGYGEPRVETINSNLRYASRFYLKPVQFPANWQNLIINGRPPNDQSGVILSVDHGRWHVTLGGMAGKAPPIDEEGFLQWAHSLTDPSIYEAIRISQPLTPIRGYGTPENHLRHFELMQRWPTGFIVTGDAVCAFNPIYGQGMTVSAFDAMILMRCLQEQQNSPGLNFEQHFQQQLAGTIATPWLLATSEDLRWPTVRLKGAKSNPRLYFLRRYLDLVIYASIVEPKIAQAYFNVLILATPLHSLTRVSMAARILAVTSKRAFKRLLRGKDTCEHALSQEEISIVRSLASSDNNNKSTASASFIERMM